MRFAFHLLPYIFLSYGGGIKVWYHLFLWGWDAFCIPPLVVWYRGGMRFASHPLSHGIEVGCVLHPTPCRVVYGFTRMIGKIFKVILPYIVGGKVFPQPLSYIFYKFFTVAVSMPQYRQRNIILPKSIIFFTGRRMEKIFLEFSTLPCPTASYCVMPPRHTPEHSNEF